MERRFQIEYNSYADKWHLVENNLSMRAVEMHCNLSRPAWEAGKYRLLELKPIKVEFKTIVDLKEIV